MADVLNSKDIQAMLVYRKQLYSLILAEMNKTSDPKVPYLISLYQLYLLMLAYITSHALEFSLRES